MAHLLNGLAKVSGDKVVHFGEYFKNMTYRAELKGTRPVAQTPAWKASQPQFKTGIITASSQYVESLTDKYRDMSQPLADKSTPVLVGSPLWQEVHQRNPEFNYKEHLPYKIDKAVTKYAPALGDRSYPTGLYKFEAADDIHGLCLIDFKQTCPLQIGTYELDPGDLSIPDYIFQCLQEASLRRIELFPHQSYFAATMAPLKHYFVNGSYDPDTFPRTGAMRLVNNASDGLPCVDIDLLGNVAIIKMTSPAWKPYVNVFVDFLCR